MPAKSSAALIPPRATLSLLKTAAADCKACDLWKKGTQTVFGEGSRRSKVLFVGEQPGNEEDLTGKPFVGPAGRPTTKRATSNTAASSTT
ncbi:MAG TPA: uracil-DNA glycosylase family protein [Pyrinomonadaceae bacterium]|nr:uracil-DNA glycosylase family protein [Pyrinomonadaceae bacterium]